MPDLLTALDAFLQEHRRCGEVETVWTVVGSMPTVREADMRRATAAIGSSVFFVVAPGVVFGVVPWWLTGWRMGRLVLPVPIRVAGAVLVVAGAAVLIHAFVRFVVEGAGTPAPVAPPERLVVGGPYRYVRNPIYLAGVAAILGQALALGQPVLLAYAAAVWAVSATFVRWYEEPVLSQQFGADYEVYRRAVPAWWPRLSPWRPEQVPDDPRRNK